MAKDQLLMNTQEGWRVPDMRQFVMDQEEVRYFEHNGHKTYFSPSMRSHSICTLHYGRLLAGQFCQ